MLQLPLVVFWPLKNFKKELLLMSLWHAVWTFQLTSSQSHIYPPCQPGMWSWHIKVQPDAHAVRTGTIVLEEFWLLALSSYTSGTSIMTEACSTKKAAVWTRVCNVVISIWSLSHGWQLFSLPHPYVSYFFNLTKHFIPFLLLVLSKYQSEKFC